MEAALRKLMEDSFGDYVSGGLGSMDTSSFPLTLRDLKLNEKKIQEDMDEEGSGKPFELTSGKIGSVSVNPGWMGVEIVASNIVLNFSFSAIKAMTWMMKREEPDEAEEEQACDSPAPAPVAPVAPRYCPQHGTSEKRVKTEPRIEECRSCHLRLQTNYADFAYCPPCSEKLERCMLCGSSAPNAGCYVPAQHLQPTTGAGAELNGAAPAPLSAAPCFCRAHDASEKRTKAEPQQMECTECHVAMQTNYAEFTLCPVCSNKQERCMICGATPASGSSAPPPAPPRAAEAGPELEPPAATSGALSGARPAAARPPDEEEEECEASPSLSRKPFAEGGFREGSRPEKRLQGSQIGCGLPCAVGGAGGDGIWGFLRIFDYGSWSQCHSQCNGGAAGFRRDTPEECSPKAPARGGA